MKALVFGSFDIVHEGHKNFIAQAAKHGSVHVVVARDATITNLKPKPPFYDEQTRLKHVKAIPRVDDARLGKEGNKYDVIAEINPDVICLGYDQWAFTDKLAEELATRGLYPKVVRLEAYKPKEFKSSIFREKMEK